MSTFIRYTAKFAHYLRSTPAVSALEYAMLIGVIAVVISAALLTFSGNLTPVLTSIGGKVATITGTAPDADLKKITTCWWPAVAGRHCLIMLKEEAMTTYAAKKFACYLRHTRAVSALEYAILVGIVAVVVVAAYETFRSDIRETVSALARQLNGAN